MKVKKVILLENVPNLGLAGDVVDVKPGYGRNYLIPRKMAQVLTPEALAEIEEVKRVALLRAERQLNAARELAEKLKTHVLQLTGKVGARGGKLYGSVTTQQIASALSAFLGVEIDKRKITLPEPIKTLGVHTYIVRLHPEIVVEGKLEVVKPPEEVKKEEAKREQI